MPLALVAPPSPTELYKVIKSVLPQVGRITLETGNVLALATLIAYQTHELERAVQRALRKKVKRKREDNSQVIKVADAIDCVEHHVWDAKNLVTTVRTLMQYLVRGGNLDTIANVVVQSSVDCIRQNALRQNTTRREHRSTTHGRPARGHGRGRRVF